MIFFPLRQSSKKRAPPTWRG